MKAYVIKEDGLVALSYVGFKQCVEPCIMYDDGYLTPFVKNIPYLSGIERASKRYLCFKQGNRIRLWETDSTGKNLKAAYNYATAIEKTPTSLEFLKDSTIEEAVPLLLSFPNALTYERVHLNNDVSEIKALGEHLCGAENWLIVQCAVATGDYTPFFKNVCWNSINSVPEILRVINLILCRP